MKNDERGCTGAATLLAGPAEIPCDSWHPALQSRAPASAVHAVEALTEMPFL